MFTHIELPHEFTLEAVPGAEITQNLKFDYSNDEVNATSILIPKTSSAVESMTIYTTGLVVYAKAAPGKTVVRTNGIFKPGDDGNLHLVGLDPKSKIEPH